MRRKYSAFLAMPVSLEETLLLWDQIERQGYTIRLYKPTASSRPEEIASVHASLQCFQHRQLFRELIVGLAMVVAAVGGLGAEKDLP